MVKSDETNRDKLTQTIASTLKTDMLDDLRKDKVSHYMLKMTYLNNKDQFISLEGHLFNARLQKFSDATFKGKGTEDRAAFCRAILEKWYRAAGVEQLESVKCGDEVGILVPFEDSVSLISDHRAVVVDGMVSVPPKYFSVLIRLLFQKQLRVGSN
jgi:hypothetical protein